MTGRHANGVIAEAITPAAQRARPPCSVAYEPQLNAKGERLVWLEPPKAEQAIAELSALAGRLATLTASSNLRGWRKAQRPFLVNGICNLHLHRNGVARKR